MTIILNPNLKQYILIIKISKLLYIISLVKFMDKTAIKTFAINSRKKLIEDVEYKMSLVGITEDKINEPISSAEGIETFQIGGSTNSIYDNDIGKRKRLVKEVKQKGFKNVVEEVAYTWFNRIIAIRFMEINNFLPEKTRVLYS